MTSNASGAGPPDAPPHGHEHEHELELDQPEMYTSASEQDSTAAAPVVDTSANHPGPEPQQAPSAAELDVVRTPSTSILQAP